MWFVELLLGLAEVGDDSVDVLLQAFPADKVATRLFVAFVLDSCAVQRGGELSLSGQHESFVHVEGLGAGDEEDAFAAVAFTI